jgi:hypothetical protein
MDGRLEMTHGSLEASASHLRVHGEQYAEALGRLRERGAGAAAWGDDGLMSGLASGYTRCVQTALDTFLHLGNVIGATGDGMATASRRMAYVEQDMTRRAAGLGDGEI